ncbi:MAG: hypothetical protein KDE55_12045 [Novosphingobium sp.]|nr:hypothetical protein [Novosphingobium sp.]
MRPIEIREASDMLWQHWMKKRRLDELPLAMRPQTRSEGYAIQAQLETKGRVVGWKIAATSEAGQAHINVDGPLAGRILYERLVPPGGRIAFNRNHMRKAELEFAFRIGTTLEPQEEEYTVEEVLEAVDTLHLAIEVPDSRYDDFEGVGAPQLIADNACADWFVIGDPVSADWRGIDLASHVVTGFINDGDPQPGIGSNVLGDPRMALAWLVNELSGLGVVLHAGQVVSTGTCVPPMSVSGGDRIRGDFGELGTISATLEE